MKKLKYQILFAILFMTIGIAAVTTNLVINATTYITSNPDDFLVYYSNATIDGEQDLSLVDSETKLVFDGRFTNVGDKKVISYDVTNASKIYDAEVTISCTESTAYLTITNSFDTNSNLSARSTRTGTLTVELSTAVIEEITQDVTCTIIANAVERDSQNIVEVPGALEAHYPMLKATNMNDYSAFRSYNYKQKIKNITFEEEIDIPDNAVESWDVSVEQNGSIMAYLVSNENDLTYYDLYIQSNSKISANEDMSYWFYCFTAVDSINGLDLLDTSRTTDMSYMFYGVGYSSQTFTLDLGNTFDTSNVTNMSNMFNQAGYNSPNFTLDLGDKFDTSNVTNMSYMFQQVGYNSTVFYLDFKDKFDTSKVIDMSHMFHATGFNNLDFTLDVSMLDTSNVTNMTYMFFQTGYNSTVFTLNLGGKFDTSKVTDMSWMFAGAGLRSTVYTLDVSNFDTSNVTTMKYMFSLAGSSSPSFNIDFGDKFDTRNVTNMSYMFNETGTFSNVYTLNLSKFDTSNVTDMSGMFAGAGYYGSVFTIDFGNNFDTSNVTTMACMFDSTGYNSPKFTLDLGDKFDTSKVTNMFAMFRNAGLRNYSFNIDLGDKFDTSNVTKTSWMFYNTGYSSSKLNITITIKNPNVTEYYNMFQFTARDSNSKIIVNYTSETSDLVDEMLKTASYDNVIKGELVE